ncbi:hypothetical protein [Haloechinothrix salitolerans]|uniref:Rv3660c-like CheY-like N-terminal domain-containing protein n=1 Tax=Haloechinothrix salitolerans TaxID=926830 RepID=A0ABW2BVD6_9PSEU
MSGFVLLITDLPSLHHEIAQHLRGVRLATRTPDQLNRDDWDRAALVFVDAQAAPLLRSRPHPLPRRDGITLLADPEDADEPDLYRHAIALGAAHLVTVPDGTGVLRQQILTLAVNPPLVVAVLDPEPSGELGTHIVGGLAAAGTATGQDVAVIDARPHDPGLRQTLQRGGSPDRLGHVRELAAGDGGPPSYEAVRQARTALAERHAVTLVHLDPHQPDTTALLRGTDLVIFPVSTGLVSAPTTRTVFAAARSATPHVHVHVVGHDLDAEVIDAVADGIGAGYPSITGAAVPAEHADAQFTGAHHHRPLWDVVTQYRPRTAQTTTPS